MTENNSPTIKVSTLVWVGIALWIIWAIYGDHSGNNTSSSAYTTSQSTTVQATSSNEINYLDAWDHIGERKTVCGTLREFYYDANNADSTGMVFVSIGARYPDRNSVTAIIWPEDVSKFHVQETEQAIGWADYVSACATGQIYVYEGHLQIELRSPSQLDLDFTICNGTNC